MKEKFGILMLATAIAVLSMASAVFANAAGSETSSGTVEPYPYISPAPGEFPIVLWGVEDNTSHQVFKDVMDCGFNAVMIQDINVNTHKIVEALNPVAGEDTIKLNLIGRMGWFATDTVYRHTPSDMPECMDYVENLFNTNRSAGNQSTITGWFLVDEPTYDIFNLRAPYYHSMAQYDTDRMVFLTLLGDLTRDDKLWEKGPSPNAPIAPLRSYVESFCKKFRPGVLVYDYYPFTVNELRQNITVRPQEDRLNNFYTALQLYSEISKKRNRPFWAFCQSKATCVDKFYNNVAGHPAPTEEYLRYEAFNALAFGAQGIQYWEYKERNVPAEKKNPSEYFALATKDGQKTPLWYFAQKVNKEIKHYSKVFLGAKLDSYYFVGDPQDTTFCDYKKGDSAKAMNVSTLGPAFNYRGSNQGALVSTLVKGDNHYIVIVNQSPFESAYLNLFLNIKDYNITDIDAYPIIPGTPPTATTDGLPRPEIPSIELMKQLTLKPGGYKIYSYSPKKSNSNQVL